MQRTYRVPLTRIGLVALLGVLVLLAVPGTSIAGGASTSTQAGQALLERGAGYGATETTEAARVRVLQQKLRALGWQPGPVDGRFGPRTEAALVRFQRNAGIAADGIAGPQTRKALKSAATRPLRRGTGYAEPNGSPRVRVLQRQLRQHGFRPGPVDGIFGPRTEVALTRLQRHGGLAANGVVTERTGRLLAHTERASTPTAPKVTHTQPVAQHRPTGPTGASDDTLDVPLMVVVGLTALLLGAGLAVFIPRLGSGGRRRLGSPALRVAAEGRPRSEPEQTAAEGLAVIGYVSVRDAGRFERVRLDEQSEAVASFCSDRGWNLLEVVRDSEEATDRGFARRGLQHALGRIARGEASCLVAPQLGGLGGSAADISRILHAVRRAGGRLVAIDVGLDTASADAEVALSALAAVGVWDRAVEPVVTAEPQRVAALRRTTASTTQATFDDVTRLRDRIATMRADGMTLQAIADRLNDEAVRTLGGGATWRPSSVRYALTSARRGTNGAAEGEQAEGGPAMR